MTRWVWSFVVAFVALIVIVIVAYVTLFSGRSEGTRIGSVSTTFRFFGPNDKVALDRFDDDAIDGIACYLARARKGGIPGAVGTAEDPSNLSLSCVGFAPIKPKNDAKLADLSAKQVFSERASILFKTIEVRRFYDPDRQTLCYVAISTKLINGSPANATSCIAVAEVK
jgi:CreA protein